jgi:peptidoglycan/LPS O-acetylase OafA/YrhL
LESISTKWRLRRLPFFCCFRFSDNRCYQKIYGRFVQTQLSRILFPAIRPYFAPVRGFSDRDSPFFNLHEQPFLARPFFFSAKKDPVFWLSIATFTFNWAIFLDLPISHCGPQWFLLWSVCVEEQFYFLYPFVLKKLGNQKKLVVFLVFILMAGILWRLTAYCLQPEKRNFQLYNSFASFDLIAIGILLYLAKEHWEIYLKENKIPNLLVCSIGFLIMSLTWMATSSNNGLDLVYAPTAMGLGLFLFLLGGFQLPVFELKYFKFLSLPGKYCYGNYLFQYFFLCFTEPYILSKTNNTPVALLIVVILSTTVSGLSFHFFEMPANHLIRRIFSTNQLQKNG